MSGLFDKASAELDEKYRWKLRRWREGAGRCVFIMLNPSTADGLKDDPTIRRCRGFAARLNLHDLLVVNLFTGRATKPSALWAMDDPVGPNADRAIEQAVDSVHGDEEQRAFDLPLERIICAWGACPPGPVWFRTMHADRVAFVLEAARLRNRDLYALGLTDDGAPRHPLYLKADAPLVAFQREGVAA